MLRNLTTHQTNASNSIGLECGVLIETMHKPLFGVELNVGNFLCVYQQSRAINSLLVQIGQQKVNDISSLMIQIWYYNEVVKRHVSNALVMYSKCIYYTFTSFQKDQIFVKSN